MTILAPITKFIRNRPYPTAALLLVTTVLAVFGNSLRNGFVWDDAIYIVNNKVYRQFDLSRIFTSLANGLEYLPVRDLSYAVDYLIGESAAVFHTDNVVIYALTVLCIFGYARAVWPHLYPGDTEAGDSRPLAAGFFTALLFAVHPLHCETVNFITCRNALLSTLFFFLSAWSFLRSLRPGSGRMARNAAYAAALVFFVLSLFSKANSIILPLILLLHVPYLPREQRRRALLSIVPFGAVAAASFFLLISIAARAHIITDRPEYWTINVAITKLVKALQIVVFYLEKLVYPVGFSAAYDTTFAWSPLAPSVIAIFTGLVVAGYFSFRFRHTVPFLFFGLCWYLISLIPVLNFFSTNPVIADRYAFLPSFAFFFVLACAGVRIAARVRPAWVAGVALVIAATWGAISISRNGVWYSEETLWRDTIRTSPDNPLGYRNLGGMYVYRGEYGKALEVLSPVIDLDPLYYHTMGLAAYRSGDLHGAVGHFKKALGRNSQYIASLYYLGVSYDRLGEPETAAGFFRHAMHSPDPDVEGLRAKAAQHLQWLEGAAR